MLQLRCMYTSWKEDWLSKMIVQVSVVKRNMECCFATRACNIDHWPMGQSWLAECITETYSWLHSFQHVYSSASCLNIYVPYARKRITCSQVLYCKFGICSWLFSQVFWVERSRKHSMSQQKQDIKKTKEKNHRLSATTMEAIWSSPKKSAQYPHSTILISYILAQLYLPSKRPS